MNEKILQGILVAVIILGSGYLIYSFVAPASVTPEAVDVVTPFDDVGEIDTPGWQTYRNEELGISFRYPENWGEPRYLQGYRIKSIPELEPVKTHYIGWGDISVTDAGLVRPNLREGIVIKISPDTWEWNGGALTGDFPMSNQGFDRLKKVSQEKIMLLNEESKVATIYWNGYDRSVYIVGSVKIELENIPASYVEVVGEVLADYVDENGLHENERLSNCTIIVEGNTAPTLRCYDEDYIRNFTDLVESIRSV